MRHRERRAVPLNIITGRSPANCRGEAADEAVAATAASIAAIGLIQPLLVSAMPGPLLKFWVDDGGCRHQALQLLAQQGKLAADAPIDCDVLVADEGMSREISLAANVVRRDLHPVEQCDAFEAMIASGLGEEKIAEDFAITVRQVRQRLKLTKLSPTVRAAWRDGKITLEAAQAFTCAPSHEAQDAYLEEAAKASYMLGPGSIRARFLNNTVRADTSEAVYVGVEAYCAAGGTIDENLFDTTAIILDPDLLARLAREKMMREGEAILQQSGFGFCVLLKDVEQFWTWPRLEPHYLPAESARLEEIETELEEEIEGETLEEGTARRIALEAENQAIEIRALERGSTPDMRAQAGVWLSLDRDGTLVAERGVMRPAETSAPAGTATTGTTPAAHTPPAKPADPIEAAASGRGMIRTILEETISKALVAIVGHRPDLALMFVVARYGGAWRPDWIADTFGLAGSAKVDVAPLPRVHEKAFDKAIAACADVPLADLTTAFAAIVARSIRLNNHALLGSLDALMRAFARRGAALRPAFVEAMDYDKYFEAATKQACLAALDAMKVDTFDRQAKKPVLAGLAAAQASGRKWLPFPLQGWAATEASSPEAHTDDEPKAEVKPLAEAMVDAIAADETAHDRLKRFLIDAVEQREGGEIKASDLYALYSDSVAEPLGQRAFGLEIASLEIEKKRRKDGYVYLGVAYKPLGGGDAGPVS